MNHALRPWKQVSVQEREFSPFSSILEGLLLSTERPTKLQSLPHITQLQFCQTFFCIISQRHGLDVGLESSYITTMQLLTKLATHRRTLMTMVSVWWNIHHSHPTWRRAISGSFQNSNLPLLGNLFQGPKTLLKLCIQIWGPYLIQSTENAFRSGGWGCNDV